MTTAPTARRRTSRIRGALVALTAVAGVIVALCSHSAMVRIGQPFPGFFVWENGFVPAIGLPSWSGAKAGLMTFLEVSDSGPCIPPERRERMFRTFFTTKAKGTGIRLAAVKRIADAHHASIEVQDAPGGGARFRVVTE